MEGNAMDEKQFIEAVERGTIKIYELEKKLFAQTNDWGHACSTANSIRLSIIERRTGVKLESVRKHNEAFCSNEKNTTQIEQGIGCAIIPLGIAGPLKISGTHNRGETYIAIATNESALIAGLNRGIKAVNSSGGVKTVVKHSFMTRAPVVECSSIEEAHRISEMIKKDQGILEGLRKEIKEHSKYTTLIRIEPFQLNRYLWLRHVFDTGEAMGMNSATKYTAISIKKLKEIFNFRLIALSGNMCTDKKAAHINVTNGRGTGIEAEAVIPKETIESVFSTTPEQIAKINLVKDMLGSALSGTLTGFNANAANTVAAIFLATGQDAAQVVESCTCFTHCEAEGNNLRIGISMPSIEVGSFGGGTGFHTARECLKLMNCDKNMAKQKLAEIIAAAVLCQELNLLGALAKEFTLAESHIKLARGEKLE